MKKVIMGGAVAVLLKASCWASMPLGSDLDITIDQLRESVRKGEMTEQDLRLEIEGLARKHRALADAVFNREDPAASWPDYERCRSALWVLSKMGDRQSLPLFEEISLSAHMFIRVYAIMGYVETAGAVGTLPFIDRMTEDKRYTKSDRMIAYRMLQSLVYAGQPQPEEGGGIDTRRPPPVLSPAERKKVHSFMLGKVQTEEDVSAVVLLDKILTNQLADYKTSVQRLAMAERFPEGNYWKAAKEEIEKIPANERKDFRTKGELLDPERKEE